MPPPSLDAALHGSRSPASPTPAAKPAKPDAPSAPGIPGYLEQLYWWAYVHPKAVRVFERDWLVNLILFGHYGRLRDAALDALAGDAGTIDGRTLQVACVYGDLTPRLCARLADGASLDVVDILPVQLANLRRKLVHAAPDAPVTLHHGDAGALAAADASCRQVLLFFLLHEMPEAVRRATLREAMRVLAPGGKLVIVDYGRPTRWHPVRPLMHQIFRRLEPCAFDLWRHELMHFMPDGVTPASVARRTWFGGLYQQLVITR